MSLHAPADAAALIIANRRGILAMLAAMTLFVSNDALVKYTSQSLPAAQLIFLRGVFASLLVLGMAAALGAIPRIRESLSKPVLTRASIEAFATVLYLASLFQLPIANATSINLAAPLFITMLAAIFLREQVGWRRWSAIAVGFVGVLLVIQPNSDGFNAYSLLCLLATLLYSFRDLLTRRIPPTTPSILITLSTAVAVTLLAGGLSLIEGWQPFDRTQLLTLALASLFLSGGYYTVIVAMRGGEMSLIAPFRYSGLLWALLLGYLVWGDIPNLPAWLGITLLIASGLYMLHRERIRARQAMRR